MAELPIPSGMGVPLVDLATHKLPALTEAATTAATRDSLPAAALSGAYTDLTSKPAIPTAAGDIGAEPAGLSTATKNAFKATLGQTSGRLGRRWGFMGDSITDSSLPMPSFGPQWWATAASMSKGRFWPSVMAGVAGQTTTQMLARIATNFPAGSVDVGFILGGTNDSSLVHAQQVVAGNITAMVAYLQSIGAQAVIGTIPPRTVASGLQTMVSAINAWIKRYGAANGIPVVDFFSVLVDPATNEYQAALTADGVHPTPAGHLLMAQKLIDTLEHFFAAPSYVVASSAADPANIVPNGFFQTWGATPAVPAPTLAKAAASSALAAGTYFYKLGYVSTFGEGLPSAEASIVAAAGDAITITIPALANWQRARIYRSMATGAETLLTEITPAGGGPQTYVDNGSVAPTAPVPLTTDHYAIPASWVGATGGGSIQLTKVTNDTDFRGTAVDILGRLAALAEIQNNFTPATPPAAGDILAISFKVKTPVTATVNRAQVNLRSAANATLSSYGLSNVTSDALGTGVHLFYGEVACPTGVTNIRVDVLTNTTGQSFRVGEFSIINLTALGLI